MLDREVFGDGQSGRRAVPGPGDLDARGFAKRLIERGPAGVHLDHVEFARRDVPLEFDLSKSDELDGLDQFSSGFQYFRILYLKHERARANPGRPLANFLQDDLGQALPPRVVQNGQLSTLGIRSRDPGL